MTLNSKSIRELVRHMVMAILVNLIVAILLVDVYFVETSMAKFAAAVRIPLAFLVMILAVNELRRIWKNTHLEKRQASGLLFPADLGSFLGIGKTAPKAETGD